MDGVLIVNKPAGMTSHDVVARVRRILNERSVGHLGTLDPSATGVLPLVVGRFTRLAGFYTDADKLYEGVIHFGVATDTYDAEGEPLGPHKDVHLSLDQVRQAAAGFTGTIQQTPPPFSAKKISGVPAYKLARKKQDVALAPKTVEVKEFEILDFDGEKAHFKAWVSSGTYIRALAHELGKILGTGAHLGELTRTAVREFRLEEAHCLDKVEEVARITTIHVMSDKKHYVKSEISPQLERIPFIHPRQILPEFPAVTVPPDQLSRLLHGAAVNLPEFSKAPLIRAFEGQTHLVAIVRRIAGCLFHPKVVLG